MYETDASTCSEKFPKLLKLLAWNFSISFMIFHIYFIFRPFPFKTDANRTVSRFIWSCSICWIIFACHFLKSGGFIRSFLSHRFWQPLSKLCLSSYLVHYVYINYVEMDQIQPPNGFTLSYILNISAGDILMSSFLGFLFHLFVEAPITNFIASILNKFPKHSTFNTSTPRKINL